jgi:serine/threonine protein kinase
MDFISINESNLRQDDIYVFVKYLGQGSFGKVNLYRNSADNSLVVWKEIALKGLDVKMRSEAFAEVEILSMLNHPNIISYYKHFIGDETLYIELEYAKAGTLAEQIKRQKIEGEYFDQETILWHFYQLCKAVEYIHEIGIMHRDIKALNIFFMQSGLLKLGDFGISKNVDPQSGLLESVILS